MTRTKCTFELTLDMFSRQMMIGRKKNLAMEANMKPWNKSLVTFFDLIVALFMFMKLVSVLMMAKKEKLAKNKKGGLL